LQIYPFFLNLSPSTLGSFLFFPCFLFLSVQDLRRVHTFLLPLSAIFPFQMVLRCKAFLCQRSFFSDRFFDGGRFFSRSAFLGHISFKVRTKASLFSIKTLPLFIPHFYFHLPNSVAPLYKFCINFLENHVSFSYFFFFSFFFVCFSICC